MRLLLLMIYSLFELEIGMGFDSGVCIGLNLSLIEKLEAFILG